MSSHRGNPDHNGNWGLIGHEAVVDLLSARVRSGRVGHAYLITGPPGIGRATLAVRLAQAVNCEVVAAEGGGDPCGECRSCDLIARRAHADMQFIEPDGRYIRIETIRDLQHDIMLRPIEARSRVAIIEEMQHATDQAADALLKTLEEPPPTSRLILTADAAESLRPTIVSRCQVVPLRPVPVDRIAAALIDRLSLSPGEASMLARLSGGRPGWAIRAADQPETLEARAAILEGMFAALSADRVGRFQYAEAISRADDLPAILDVWQSFWRDVLLVVEGSRVLPTNADQAAALDRIAASITPDEARRALRAVRRTVDALSRNTNTRLTLDVMLLDMPYT
jgi:DNA polymerase-3 subunit delta'